MIIHLKMVYDTNKLLICIIIISCPSCYSQCDKSFVKTENYDKVEGLNPFPKENHTKTDLLDADCKEYQITEEMVTTIEPTKPADDHTIDIYNNTTVYDPITTRESSETTFTTVGTSISTIPSNLDEAAKNHSVIITAFSETNIPTQIKTDFSETTLSEPTKATISIDITQNISVLDETTITTAEISEITVIENTSTLLSDETPLTTAETSKTTLNMDTTIEYDDPPLIFDFSTPKTEVDVISLAPFSTTIDTTVTSLTGILVSATEMESEEAIDTIDPTLYNPTQSIQYNMTQTTSLTTVEPNDTTHMISMSTTEMSEMPPNIATTITDSTVTTLDIYTSITESYEKSHIMTDSPFYSTSRTTENTVSTVVTEPSEVIITGITHNITTPQTDQPSTTEEIITTSKFSPKQEILTTLIKPSETTQNYFAITTEPNETAQNNSMSTTRTLETTQNVEFLPPVTINEISTIEPDIYENTTVPTRTTEYELPFLEAISKEIGYTPPFTKNGTRRGRTDKKWSTSKFRTTKKINPITKMPKYKPTVRPSPKSSTKSPITTNKTNNVGNTGKNNTLVTSSADNDIRRTNFSFNVGKEEKEEIKYRRVTCDRTTTPTKILAMSVGASVTGIFIFTLKFFMQRNCKAVVKFFEP